MNPYKTEKESSSADRQLAQHVAEEAMKTACEAELPVVDGRRICRICREPMVGLSCPPCDSRMREDDHDDRWDDEGES